MTVFCPTHHQSEPVVRLVYMEAYPRNHAVAVKAELECGGSSKVVTSEQVFAEFKGDIV